MATVGDIFYDGKKVAYVPYAQQWLEKNAAKVKLKNARPGDIVIFDWDGKGNNDFAGGSRDHIGFIRAKSKDGGATQLTIEGNTNGSKVCNRSRAKKWIWGIYRLNVSESVGKDIIATATKYLGEGGSRFWKAYGVSSGTAWCVIFVWYVLHHTNVSTEIPSTGKATSSTVPAVPSGTLKSGSTGTAVKNLQKCLNYVQGAGLTVDGKFGPKTLTAVKTFQKAENLTVDGIYGTNTQAAMKKAVEGKSAANTGTSAASTTTAKTTTTTTSTTTTAKTYKGFDISVYQKTLTKSGFAKAKSGGYSFVIIRLGYTASASGKPTLDTQFENNYKCAAAAGLNVGVYYYSTATTEKAAQTEAAFVLKTLAGRKLQYPAFIDVEDSGQAKLGKEKLAAVINAFCKAVTAGGYRAGVYANLNFLKNKIGTVGSNYTIWLAQYPKATYTGRYEMHQYSSSGTISGIGSPLDMDTATLAPKECPIGATTSKAQKAVDWAVKIAGDNSFSYGPKPYVSRCGCYFCGTNGGKLTAAKGTKYEGDQRLLKTYVCMTFIGAAYAHGAGDSEILAACKKGGMTMYLNDSNFSKFTCWKKIGLCKDLTVKDLKPGDVIVKWSQTNGDSTYPGHVCMYTGGDNLVEACSNAEDPFGTATIAVRSGAAARLKSYGTDTKRKNLSYVMRYTK